MTEAQKALGIIGAIACGIMGLNMTDSGSGALAGAVGGFVIGSAIPVIANIAVRIALLAIPLLVFGLNVIQRPPVSFPEAGGFHLTNDCALPIEIYLWWRDDTGSWGGTGPWTFAGNSSRALAVTGGPVVLTSGTIYFYAASQDGRATWEGDNRREIRGRSFQMRRLDIGKPENGHYALRLTCDS